MFLFSLQAVPRAVDNQRHQEAPAGLREAAGGHQLQLSSGAERLVGPSLRRVGRARASGV